MATWKLIMAEVGLLAGYVVLVLVVLLGFRELFVVLPAFEKLVGLLLLLSPILIYGAVSGRYIEISSVPEDDD